MSRDKDQAKKRIVERDRLRKKRALLSAMGLRTDGIPFKRDSEKQLSRLDQIALQDPLIAEGRKH